MGWIVEVTCKAGCKHYVAKVKGTDVHLTDEKPEAKDFAFRTSAFDLGEAIVSYSEGNLTFKILPILYLVSTLQ